MAPPYQPFWAFPLLDQLVVGIVFWSIILGPYKLVTWLNKRKARRIWDATREQREREGVEAYWADFAQRRAARRQKEIDRMIDWQIETGIPFEDLEHEELERIALGEPDLIITFPIRPTKGPAA